jgi:hypothetical protein
MSKDTEQDLAREPAAHWEHFLEPKLKNSLLKKKRPLASEDSTVALSVTDRKERDLIKLFDDTSIDWPVIQKSSFMRKANCSVPVSNLGQSFHSLCRC